GTCVWMRATLRRELAISIFPAMTGTVSWRSNGSICENQPTQAITATIAPTIVTTSRLTKPVAIKAIPSASSSGHAVGLGSCTRSGVFVACDSVFRSIVPSSLATQAVHNREDDHPNDINEVPIES